MEKQSILLYLQQHLEGNHFILPENLKHPCLVLRLMGTTVDSTLQRNIYALVSFCFFYPASPTSTGFCTVLNKSFIFTIYCILLAHKETCWDNNRTAWETLQRQIVNL